MPGRDSSQIPPETLYRSRKGKDVDFETDWLTGERVYKNNRKNMLPEEKRRTPVLPYVRQFSRKLDPDNIVP